MRCTILIKQRAVLAHPGCVNKVRVVCIERPDDYRNRNNYLSTSKSPCLAPETNDSQVPVEYERTVACAAFESRTRTLPSVGATSTHSPLPMLRLALRQPPE